MPKTSHMFNRTQWRNFSSVSAHLTPIFSGSAGSVSKLPTRSRLIGGRGGVADTRKARSTAPAAGRTLGNRGRRIRRCDSPLARAIVDFVDAPRTVFALSRPPAKRRASCSRFPGLGFCYPSHHAAGRVGFFLPSHRAGCAAIGIDPLSPTVRPGVNSRSRLHGFVTNG